MMPPHCELSCIPRATSERSILRTIVCGGHCASASSAKCFRGLQLWPATTAEPNSECASPLSDNAVHLPTNCTSIYVASTSSSSAVMSSKLLVRVDAYGQTRETLDRNACGSRTPTPKSIMATTTAGSTRNVSPLALAPSAFGTMKGKKAFSCASSTSSSPSVGSLSMTRTYYNVKVVPSASVQPEVRRGHTTNNNECSSSGADEVELSVGSFRRFISADYSPATSETLTTLNSTSSAEFFSSPRTSSHHHDELMMSKHASSVQNGCQLRKQSQKPISTPLHPRDGRDAKICNRICVSRRADRPTRTLTTLPPSSSSSCNTIMDGRWKGEAVEQSSGGCQSDTTVRENVVIQLLPSTTPRSSQSTSIFRWHEPNTISDDSTCSPMSQSSSSPTALSCTSSLAVAARLTKSNCSESSQKARAAHKSVTFATFPCVETRNAMVTPGERLSQPNEVDTGMHGRESSRFNHASSSNFVSSSTTIKREFRDSMKHTRKTRKVSFNEVVTVFMFKAVQ